MSPLDVQVRQRKAFEQHTSNIIMVVRLASILYRASVV
jgi:hypothetical protein